jgi:CBS domain containing-hemolysin-like protein
VEGSPDQVVGLIHIKDLLFRASPIQNIADIKREIIYIPEGMPVDRLLAEFQRRGTSTWPWFWTNTAERLE